MFFQHYSEKIESSCPIYSCSLTYQNSLVVNTYGQALIPHIPLPSKPRFQPSVSVETPRSTAL